MTQIIKVNLLQFEIMAIALSSSYTIDLKS
ncbi:MAG: hypothetical protein K0S74_1056 [Chlamydiales bacterium]|jgi:hypothetical protein|nr:hypothetical protein [Chlamydiales bacterium]